MKRIDVRILDEYGIDVNNIDLFKIYSIDTPKIPNDELSQKFAAFKTKWTRLLSSPKEKEAKQHLANAEKYEKILSDAQIRVELYEYYKNKNASKNAEVCEFAKNFFNIIKTSSKINKQKIEFFFKYFKDQRANKVEIRELLKKEFGIKFDVDVKDDDKEEEQKDTSGTIVNSFSEFTIISIKECYDKFEEARAIENKCAQCPDLSRSFYDFLEIDKYNSKNIEEYKQRIESLRIEMANLRYDNGQEYTPLVDIFNKMYELLKNCGDVLNNFNEFKLLIKYNTLTPYMYLLDTMKKSTLTAIFENVASQCGFLNINDFLVSYFLPVHDNFNISTIYIQSQIRKARNGKVGNDILKKLLDALNIDMDCNISIQLVNFLYYWPIYFAYNLIFKPIRFVVKYLPFITTALIGVAPFFYGNPFTNIFYWFAQDGKEMMNEILTDTLGASYHTPISWIASGLIALIVFVLEYIAWPCFIPILLNMTADSMEKKMKLNDINAIFKYHIFDKLKEYNKLCSLKYNTKAKRRQFVIKHSLIAIFSYIALAAIVVLAIKLIGYSFSPIK